MSRLSQCMPAISSHSLGRAYVGHSMLGKLTVASHVGFKGIEIFYEDIDAFAQAKFPPAHPPSDQELEAAAAEIREICDVNSLSVVCLQPFSCFEGLLDRHQHAELIKRMRVWVRLARILRTDLIAIPSNYKPANETTGDMDRIVADLREIAELGMELEGGDERHQDGQGDHEALDGQDAADTKMTPMRFSYEALGFGTHIDTWEGSWAVVKAVDRPNFGLCLDTFNIAARAWADPTAEDGRRSDGDEEIDASLRRLRAEVPPERVFQVQVVDGDQMEIPLDRSHPYWTGGMSARMYWSRNYRLFYGERNLGAYLPVRQICASIFEHLGWRGWVSMELFNKSLESDAASVPLHHARRGWESWRALIADFPKIATASPPYTNGSAATHQ